MTKEELIKELIEAEDLGDEEAIHGNQDDLLLEYINDPKVTEIFKRTTKWYA